VTSSGVRRELRKVKGKLPANDQQVTEPLYINASGVLDAILKVAEQVKTHDGES
jgi:hypothetical protein